MIADNERRYQAPASALPPAPPLPPAAAPATAILEIPGKTRVGNSVSELQTAVSKFIKSPIQFSNELRKKLTGNNGNNGKISGFDGDYVLLIFPDHTEKQQYSKFDASCGGKKQLLLTTNTSRGKKTFSSGDFTSIGSGGADVKHTYVFRLDDSPPDKPSINVSLPNLGTSSITPGPAPVPGIRSLPLTPPPDKCLEVDRWLDSLRTNDPTWDQYSEFQSRTNISPIIINECIFAKSGTVPSAPPSERLSFPPGPAPVPGIRSLPLTPPPDKCLEVDRWLDSLRTNDPTWDQYSEFQSRTNISPIIINECIFAKSGTVPSAPPSERLSFPPGPAPAPAPASASVTSSIVVSQKCRNVISYLIRDKKSLTYKEYYDIWSDENADISQEEVDECLKQHGIPIPEACTQEIEDWLDKLPKPNFPSVKEFNQFIITSGNIPDQVMVCIRTRRGAIIAKGTSSAGITPAGMKVADKAGQKAKEKAEAEADLMKMGRDSYKKLSKIDPDPDDSLFLEQIPFLFSNFNSCIDAKNFLTEENTLSKEYKLLKDETVDYWNVMNAYLQIIGKPDDEEKWKAVDSEYNKLAEARRLTKFNKYEDKFDKELMRGGVKTKELSTDIFNKSLIANDDIEIAKFNRSILRTEKKLMDEINYFDRKYSLGLQGISPSSSSKAKEDSKYIDELLDEVYEQEKKKSKYIEDIAHPEHKFEKILNKFKTETQLISWLEKAKSENIKANAESKKATQKLKTLMTLKESVDKCIKNMKKSLNYKCEIISQYKTVLDKCKDLENTQIGILELNSLRLDPARGSNTIQLFLEKYQLKPLEFITKIQSETVVLETLLQTLRDTIRDSPLAGGGAKGISGILAMAGDSIQEGVVSSEQNLRGLVDKSGIVRTFSYKQFIQLKNEFSMFMEIEDRFIKELKAIFEANKANYTMKLAYFIELLTLPNSGIIELWKNFVNKHTLIAMIIRESSAIPVTSEIARKRQEGEGLRQEMSDMIEDIKTAKESPVDVSTCIDSYKATISKENSELEKELEQIETATEESLKKVPQAIEEVKNQLRVVFNQGNDGKGKNTNLSLMTVDELVRQKEGLRTGIEALRRKQNDRMTGEKEKNKIKNQIKTFEDTIRNIERELSNRKNAPKTTGGNRFAHTTCRNIKR